VYEDPSDQTKVWKVNNKNHQNGAEHACLAANKDIGPEFYDAKRIQLDSDIPTIAFQMRRMSVTLNDLDREVKNGGYKHWDSLDSALSDLVDRLNRAWPTCHQDIVNQNIMFDLDASGTVLRAQLIDWDGEISKANEQCDREGEAVYGDMSTIENLHFQLRLSFSKNSEKLLKTYRHMRNVMGEQRWAAREASMIRYNGCEPINFGGSDLTGRATASNKATFKKV
jgi:hypothetical protein